MFLSSCEYAIAMHDTEGALKFAKLLTEQSRALVGKAFKNEV